jgi:hypothetical protein
MILSSTGLPLIRYATENCENDIAKARLAKEPLLSSVPWLYIAGVRSELQRNATSLGIVRKDTYIELNELDCRSDGAKRKSREELNAQIQMRSNRLYHPSLFL